MEPITLIGMGVIAASGVLIAKSYKNTKKIKELQNELDSNNPQMSDVDKEKAINAIINK